MALEFTDQRFDCNEVERIHLEELLPQQSLFESVAVVEK